MYAVNRTGGKQYRVSQGDMNAPEFQARSRDEIGTLTETFHLQRQRLGLRTRVLGQVLIPVTADYRVCLKRAPDFQAACTEAWGPPSIVAERSGDTTHSVVSLRELQAVVSAHEWRKKGVPVAALGASIHPHRSGRTQGSGQPLLARCIGRHVSEEPRALRAVGQRRIQVLRGQGLLKVLNIGVHGPAQLLAALLHRRRPPGPGGGHRPRCRRSPAPSAPAAPAGPQPARRCC